MESKKILLPIKSVTDDNQVKFAKRLTQIFSNLGHRVSVVDLSSSDDDMYVQSYLRQEKADLLVTVDCAGFELRLLGDDLFYNSLCIPAMHFLTKAPNEFVEPLSNRMNFTMECYVVNDVYKKWADENLKRFLCTNIYPESMLSGNVLEEYIPSNQIKDSVKELPKVFYDMFTYGFNKRKDMKDSVEALDDYLDNIGFIASDEEKKELVSFIDMGYLYADALEMEDSMQYIEQEMKRIME